MGLLSAAKALVRRGRDQNINDIDLISRQEMDWIARKMQFLDVESSGACDGGRFAFIRLRNGLVFYSFPTAAWQLDIYRNRREFFPDNLKEEALNVAFDIINRFLRENVGMWIPPLTYHLAALGRDCALIDVGAYLGYGAMRVAAMSSSGGKLLCVEAEPDSFMLMQRMIEENKFGTRMKAVHCALGDVDGTVTLKTEVSEGNRQANIMIEAMRDEVSGVDYNLAGKNYRDVTVPLRRLDTLLPELGFIGENEPFMMHLGINGAELKALRGSVETLRQRSRFGVKVSTRYFNPNEGPIHNEVKSLLASVPSTKVLDIEPHVYGFRWGQ